MRVVLFVLLAAAIVGAQSKGIEEPKFEVASVKAK